jgi:DNA-binding response OmpR family regulator
MQILVIEDEPDMRDNMVEALQQEMYIVEPEPRVHTGREGRKKYPALGLIPD